MRLSWQKVYRILSVIFFAILALLLMKNLILDITSYDKVKTKEMPQMTPTNLPQISPGPKAP